MSPLIDARPARLTAAEFFAMVESGAFGERRVFLGDRRLCGKTAKTTAVRRVGPGDAIGLVLDGVAAGRVPLGEIF